jgi:PAS domain S-box-containing protein
VLNAISDFVRTEIDRDLKFLAHEIYNICNKSFDELLQSGSVGDESALIINQALTLGQIEDFFRQKNLEGLVYHIKTEELLVETSLPVSPERIIAEGKQERGISSLVNEVEGFFSYSFEFSPWDWQMVLMKTAKEYSHLNMQVKRAHVNTAALLLIATILLIFFLYGSIKRPINTIVNPIKKGQRPEYKGIDVFEFLSENIASMMNSLRQSEEKYRSIFENAIEGIFQTTPDGRYISVNPALVQIYGYESEEDLITGLTESDGKRSVDPQLWKELIRLLHDEGVVKDFEFDIYRKDGSIAIVSVNAHAIADEKGNCRYLEGSMQDITERKRVGEALRRQNEYLAALHEITLGLISRLDLDDLLQGLIIRAGQLFGTPHGFVDLVDPDKGVLDRKVGRGVLEQSPNRYRPPGVGLAGTIWQSGEQLVIEDYDAWSGRAPYFDHDIMRAVMGAPLKSGQEVVGVIGIAYDTQSDHTFGDEDVQLLNSFAQLASIALDNAKFYSEAHESREAAEAANRTKSAFLANMSHELRTPLNAIIGYSEMLMEDAEELEQEQFVSDLRRIHTSGRHLLMLINDVLDLSKIEADKMELHLETFDVPSMIEDVAETIRPLAHKNSNTLKVHFPDDFGTMHTDLTKMRQTLFNLLSNACKFTEQGTITLAVSREIVDGVAWFIFSVSDTGIGMTEEQLGKLFQTFSQVHALTGPKYGGTGLGLVISKRFCQMMGGDIIVESEYGVGSTFTIRVPVHVADRQAEQEPVV